MEIPQNIITRTFALIADSPQHIELREILESLSTQRINDILFKGDEEGTIRKTDYKIYQIVSQCLPGLHSGNEKSFALFASIVAISNQYLETAISKGNIKALLIFLSVNCYIKIDIKHFLNYQKHEEHSKTYLSQEILKLLQNVRLETKAQNDAPYYERELKSISEEGLKEENIEKIYGHILAVERGGQGFHFNFLHENLIDFFFQFDKNSFTTQLNSLNHPEANVFYLQSFQKDALNEIAYSKETLNKWSLFELMRQIIDKEAKNKEVVSEDNNAIIKCLSKLYHTDDKIYKQSISFFHKSILFNSALGSQLKELNKNETIEIFQSLLPIDKYAFNLEPRTILLEEFKKEVEPENYEAGLETVYKRWQQLYFSISNTEDSYQNDLLLTDFVNFVVTYHTGLSKKRVTDLILDILNKLIWINSEWFKSESQQITRYNLYLTDLYLLSYAFRNKELSDTKVFQLICELKNNEQIETKYSSNDTNPLQIIEDNINWKEISPK